MGSRETTLVVLGPPGPGKAATLGCMLFKVSNECTINNDLVWRHWHVDDAKFPAGGDSKYDQAANNLKSLGITPLLNIMSLYQIRMLWHPRTKFNDFIRCKYWSSRPCSPRTLYRYFSKRRNSKRSILVTQNSSS